MAAERLFSEIRLVNRSTGDPVLFVDSPGRNDAFLFDAGTLGSLPLKRLADLQAVFLSHFHMDHFCDFDRILRANLDCDKTLKIFGPAGTIERIGARIKSYHFQFFPSMKIVLEVHELHPGRIDVARFDCGAKFPPPEVESRPWKRSLLFETPVLKFEAVFADHTVPCVSYALIEKAGHHADPVKMSNGSLKPGRWVAHALDLLREDADLATVLEIDGGRYTLETLAEQYFSSSRGTRLAFITDTAWSDASRPALVKLASKAQRLYCDCYYAHEQLKQANQHRHMTAVHAAELASKAKVDQLILMHFANRYAGRYLQLVDEARAVFAKTSAELAPEDIEANEGGQR